MLASDSALASPCVVCPARTYHVELQLLHDDNDGLCPDVTWLLHMVPGCEKMVDLRAEWPGSPFSLFQTQQ